MFKVLGVVVYWIIHKNICLDYVVLKKYPNISSIDQSFEETLYKSINGIYIDEVLVNRVLCNTFEK